MNPLNLLLLLLTAGGAFIFIVVCIIYAVSLQRTQRKIRDLDYTIWALESGAETVSLRQRDKWLEIVIKERDLSFANTIRANNVIVEKHHRYKSFVFDDHSKGVVHPRKGLLVMLKNKSCPRLLIVPTDKINTMHKRFFDPLPLDDTILPDGISAFYNFRTDQSQVNMHYAHEFLERHQDLFEIFKHPGLLEFFIHQNYIAAYFSNASVKYPANQELFGLDEQIAKAILKDEYSGNDPAVEIKLLKDEES